MYLEIRSINVFACQDNPLTRLTVPRVPERESSDHGREREEGGREEGGGEGGGEVGFHGSCWAFSYVPGKHSSASIQSIWIFSGQADPFTEIKVNA